MHEWLTWRDWRTELKKTEKEMKMNPGRVSQKRRARNLWREKP